MVKSNCPSLDGMDQCTSVLQRQYLAADGPGLKSTKKDMNKPMLRQMTIYDIAMVFTSPSQINSERNLQPLGVGTYHLPTQYQPT